MFPTNMLQFSILQMPPIVFMALMGLASGHVYTVPCNHSVNLGTLGLENSAAFQSHESFDGVRSHYPANHRCTYQLKVYAKQNSVYRIKTRPVGYRK